MKTILLRRSRFDARTMISIEVTEEELVTLTLLDVAQLPFLEYDLTSTPDNTGKKVKGIAEYASFTGWNPGKLLDDSIVDQLNDRIMKADAVMQQKLEDEQKHLDSFWK